MAFVTCTTCGHTDVDSFGRCVLCGTYFDFEEEKEMNESIKALVVGRHTPDLGDSGIEVVGQENVLFPTDRAGTVAELFGLTVKAREQGANVVLLQNTPGVVTAALMEMMAKAGGQLPFPFAVIISVPGERQAGVVKLDTFQSEDPDSPFGVLGKKAAQKAAEFVQFANGRAKVEVEGNVLSVTVDPVTPFVFSHIEWL